MSKSTVSRIFVGSLLALVSGLVLMFVTADVGYNAGAFTMHGPDVAGIQSTPGGVATVLLGFFAITLVVAGGIGQFVAWIGALVATAKGGFIGWFLVLLLFGLLATAFVPMIAYVIAGPNERTYQGGAAQRPATVIGA